MNDKDKKTEFGPVASIIIVLIVLVTIIFAVPLSIVFALKIGNIATANFLQLPAIQSIWDSAYKQADDNGHFFTAIVFALFWGLRFIFGPQMYRLTCGWHSGKYKLIKSPFHEWDENPINETAPLCQGHEKLIKVCKRCGLHAIVENLNTDEEKIIYRKWASK